MTVTNPGVDEGEVTRDGSLEHVRHVIEDSDLLCVGCQRDCAVAGVAKG